MDLEQVGQRLWWSSLIVLILTTLFVLLAGGKEAPVLIKNLTILVIGLGSLSMVVAMFIELLGKRS